MIFGINTTRYISKLSQISFALTAREITCNNFEIWLVVFMPNITTNHAITYTNWSVFSLRLFNETNRPIGAPSTVFFKCKFWVRPISEYLSTPLERGPQNYRKLTNFNGDTSKDSQDIAPQSRESLQTFVWWGARCHLCFLFFRLFGRN